MLSDAFVVTIIGRIYDTLGTGPASRSVAVLPAIVALVLAAIW